MRTDDFAFVLPEASIATTPASPRDHSRLLVVDVPTRSISHHIFHELPSLLPGGTHLIRNNSKVIPARIPITFPTGAKGELFFLRAKSRKSGMFLVKPGKKFPEGQMVTCSVGDVPLHIQVRGSDASGTKELFFLDMETDLVSFLHLHGHTPLPPYIKGADASQLKDHYQTTYAKHDGSVAAPTAGLHFTPEVDRALHGAGMHIDEVTLHVGAGTFLPVKSETLADHQMHSEIYSLSRDLLTTLYTERAQHTPILAVGTTSLRVLETVAGLYPDVATIPSATTLQGDTDIFIYPPYTPKLATMLLTNFHLPESTLLMLTAAMIGDREWTLTIYQEAIQLGYRFYSFGDAMLIRR